MRGFLVLVYVIVQCSAQDLIVKLPNGKVQGRTINTPNGETFYAWRHIPYAKPPVGELRFKPPVEPDPWTGVLDGSKDSKACISFANVPGYPAPSAGYGEDCLYVNVYSPVPPNSSFNLPVMLWIYGGSFQAGHADFTFYDPSPILEEGVTVVSFNFRLDEVLSGNGALKDHVAAMQWTNKNIAHFGGNSSDITIFGESAGAGSVGFHLVSPKAKGLFAAGILESGTSLSVPPQTDARKNALKLARAVNSSIVESSSSEDILKALQAVDASLLVNISLTVGIRAELIFEPESDSAYLTRKQLVYESFESGSFSQVPIIIGINSAESLGIIPGCERVAHTEELQYLFNISTAPIKTEAEYLTRRRFVKLWTNFAKTKNPTPGDDSAELLEHVTWEKFDDKTLKYLDIRGNLELKSKFSGGLTDFWTHLWETYSYRPYVTF